MRSRAFAVLVAGAWGLTTCGRTELDGARVSDGGVDDAPAEAAVDRNAPEAPDEGPCRWTFAPQVTYGAKGSPVGVAIGDFSGDGVPDILVVSIDDGIAGSSDNVSLLINGGDGTFARRATFAAGLMPFGMVTGDFSGDGSLDLAVIYEFQASAVSHELSVFLNRGDGTFAPPASYPINGGAFDVATGDFSGDGRLDLALIDAQAQLSVLTNRGDGTFGVPAQFPAGVYADHVATADFNGDGALDLATGGTFAENVLLNQRDGTFGAPAAYPYAADCNYLGTIVADDVTGDGAPDLIRSCFQGGALVSVRANNGDGTLGPEKTFATGDWPWGLAVADLSGDGRHDLAVANSFAYAKTVSVLANAGGTLGAQVTYAATTPKYIAAGDLNGDGRPDLVTAGGSAVSVLLSTCE